MRIAFHADLNHPQAAVVWGAREALAARGLDLFDGILADAAAEAAADAHVVHSGLIGVGSVIETLLGYDAPTVILERIDGAQITGPVRGLLKHPKIAAVIKNTVHGDWRKYNGACWRAHEWPCRVAMGEGEPAPVPMLPEDKWISVAEYNKLAVGFSFAAYEHLRPLIEGPPPDVTRERPFLLNFAGTVDYGPEVPWLDWHRRRCVDAIRAIPGRHFVGMGRPLTREEFWESLRQSVFCVSPWGLGEACWRDFEAVLCGCIVIKPDTRGVLTSPPGFYDGAVHSCDPGFGDLADVVKRLVLSEVPIQIGEWADRVRAHASPEAVAARLAEIVNAASTG